MKKFYTIISLQQDLDDERSAYCYQAVGNPTLQLDHKTRFPIMTAMEGYTQPGEEIAVIAVVTDLAAGHRNLELFRSEVEELCRRKGLVCPGVQVVTVPEDDRVATHTATFQKLLNYAADGDELFSCMTYGTKPMVHRPDDGGAVCLSGEEADHHLLHRLWPDPAPGAGQEHLDGPGV